MGGRKQTPHRREHPAQRQDPALEQGLEELTKKIQRFLANEESADSYEKLTAQFKNLADSKELSAEMQQLVDELLQQAKTEDRTTLQAKAQAVNEGLASWVKNIQAKQVRFNYVRFEDDSDFLQEKLTPEVEQLAEQSKKAQDSIEQLCTIFNLEKPDLRPQAPISAETIKNTVKFVLDTTVPGGELIQLLLGMKEMPTDAKGYATTAASIVMDMLPIGKVLIVVKGPAGKALMQQVEKQVLKQAEKRALKMVGKTGVKSLNRIQGILKPGGKAVGVQIGNDPAIRTITKVEAETIIKQLMDAGAKQVEKPNYKGGVWYELPSGGGFGVRTKCSTASLKHSTPNTIDLHDLRLDGIIKLKY